jgi:uncharacterized protein (TIGR00296 family)
LLFYYVYLKIKNIFGLNKKITMVEQTNKINDDVSLLCKYCFRVLENHLNKTEAPIFPFQFKNINCPLFVTWKIGEDEDLRGCIGTFESESLEKNLPKYALIAALKDTRFTPITKKELKDLHCGVSLLTDFEKSKDCYDWEVGKHGIQIFYNNYSATFLPEVAQEQNWDKNTTLQQLLRKSGCKEALNKVESLIECTRYQSKKHSISYAEYKS